MSTHWAGKRPIHSNTTQMDFRVGPNTSNLLKLRDMQINAPDQALYKPYAVSYVRADLSKVGDGVSTAEWIWDVMSYMELASLLELWFGGVVATTSASAGIRMGQRTGDFAEPEDSFVNYSCTVHRPELFGPDGIPIVGTPVAVQTVKIIFVDLT